MNCVSDIIYIFVFVFYVRGFWGMIKFKVSRVGIRVKIVGGLFSELVLRLGDYRFLDGFASVFGVRRV